MDCVEDGLLALFEGSLPVLEERAAGDQAGILQLEGGLEGGFDAGDPGICKLAGRCGGLVIGHGRDLFHTSFSLQLDAYYT